MASILPQYTPDEVLRSRRAIPIALRPLVFMNGSETIGRPAEARAMMPLHNVHFSYKSGGY